MPIIPSSEREYVKHIFSMKLEKPVLLLVYTSRDSRCKYCKETEELAKDLSELSGGKIVVEKLDVSGLNLAAEEIYGAPALKIVSNSDDKRKIRFFGIPAGYEFGALIDDILDVSRGKSRLSLLTVSRIKDLKQKIAIKVFVTPSCPYCPKAVRLAHMLAMENPLITGDMIEALEFPELARKYNVMSVPHIVINDSYAFVGAFPEQVFVQHVLKALRGEKALIVSQEGVTPLK